MSDSGAADKPTQGENGFRAQIKEIFRKDSKETGEGKDIPKLLTIVIVGMCFVSFLATYNGLRQYVFVDYPVRAMLVSLALQTILLVLALRMPDYLRICSIKKRQRLFGRRGSDRSGDTGFIGRLKRRILGAWCYVSLYSISFILVYVLALSGSVWFDYVFLCNQAYSFNNQGLYNAQMYLEEGYDTLLADAESQIKKDYDSSRKTLINRLNAIVSEPTSADGSTSASSSSSGIKANIKALSSYKNPTFYPYAKRAKKLVNNYSDTASDQLIQDIAELRDQVSTDIKNKQKTADSQRATADSYREQMKNYAIGDDARNELSSLAATADASAQEYDNEVDELNQVLSDLTSLEGIIARIKSVSELSGNSAISSIVSKLSSSDVDSKELEEDLRVVAENIVDFDASSGTQTLQIKSKNDLEDAIEAYIVMESAKKGVKTLRKDGLTSASPNFEEEGAEELWRSGWEEDLKEFNDVVRGVSAEIGGESYTEFVNRSNDMRHLYLSNLNALEQGIEYMKSQYNQLAIVTFLIALFLDLASLGIGMFLFARSNALREVNE